MGSVLAGGATAGVGQSDLSANLVSTVDMLELVKESRGLTASRGRRIKSVKIVTDESREILDQASTRWGICGTCSQERALAIWARSYVRDKLLYAQHVEIISVARDKYFRTLATMTTDGTDLADDLIAAGLGVPYDGKSKKL